MRKLFDWYKDILTDALAKTIAGVLVGVLLTVGYGAIAYRISAFLTQQLSVSVLLLLILSMFAAVGVLYPVSRIWELISASRRHTGVPILRDPVLESSAAQLRRVLAIVEAGPNLTYEKEVKKFTAEVLAAFDDWESALHRYLSPAERREVRGLRLEVGGRSLLHSRQEAKQWLAKVKDLTTLATTHKT
jgi:hypothetical protein